MPDWNTEALPVLVAIHRAAGKPGHDMITSFGIASELDMDHARVRTVMSYLAATTPPFIDTEVEISQQTGDIMLTLTRLRSRTLEELDGWPVYGFGADAGTRLLELLDERIAEATPEERPKLKALRDAVKTVGTGVVTRVLSDLAGGAL